MNEQKYRIRMNERAIELLMHKDEYDPDIWNLEYMITQIMPYSTNWNSGCIRSLRKAINTLKKKCFVKFRKKKASCTKIILKII